jgi:hypothetical protein
MAVEDLRGASLGLRAGDGVFRDLVPRDVIVHVTEGGVVRQIVDDLAVSGTAFGGFLGRCPCTGWTTR